MVWYLSTWTAQHGSNCHVWVVPPPVSLLIPEEGSQRSQAALWEGECHACSGPLSRRPPGITREQLENASHCRGGAGSFQLGVRVSLLLRGDFRLQGSPASIINCTNYLADGRRAGGGLVVTAVFQLSSSGHLLSPTSIPQGVIKAIKMGSVNSTSGCFLGSGGFPSSSQWLPLLPPQLQSLAG